MTFTSLPIFFYCVFDFEYLKSSEYEEGEAPKEVTEHERPPVYFMEHPLLFKYSMNNEYFGSLKFVGYLAYAMFHAAIIYYVCFYFP